MNKDKLAGLVVWKGGAWLLRRRFGDVWYVRRRYGPRFRRHRRHSEEMERKLFAAGIIATTLTGTVILQRRALR